MKKIFFVLSLLLTAAFGFSQRPLAPGMNMNYVDVVKGIRSFFNGACSISGWIAVTIKSYNT
jgi:hypothetical protein